MTLPVDGGPTRIERDLIGPQRIPSSALYGVHTARAWANFNTGGERLVQQPALLEALARVKAAAALANSELGLLPSGVGDAIVQAAREVASGELHEHFPLEIVQGGGGTSTNMNMNEVLANRASVILGADPGSYGTVHPTDHVNRCQSTNDVMPTAVAIAVRNVAAETLASLEHLHDRLIAQADAHEGLEHLGRTCLQDALPVPVAALHRAHAFALARSRAELGAAVDRLLAVPLGATAVGTGLGVAEGYTPLVLRYLEEETGLQVRAASHPLDGLASLEPLATVSQQMASAGRVVARIAGDLRLLASGPIGGVGEIALPAVQAGSSMMPGKVNPVIPELAIQVSFQLAGAAHAVQLAAAVPELEVTTMGPVVASELLRGLRRLSRVALLFADRCIDGLAWRRSRVEENLRGSLHEAVEAAVSVGYDEATRQEMLRNPAK